MQTVSYKDHLIQLGGECHLFWGKETTSNMKAKTLIGAKRAITKAIREASQVRAEIYDFGHDVYGNPTSHFSLWQDGKLLFNTGRRVQCGYGSDRSDGARVKAMKLTGQSLKLLKYEGRRSNGSIDAIFE